MSNTFALHQIARLPLPGDNVAVAIQRLEAGTQIENGTQRYELSATVLEGHRFAVQSILSASPLLSWGLPFGIATRHIEPGDYICNASILDALRVRNLDFVLPDHGNFRDNIQPYQLDETAFRPASQLEIYPETRSFMGFHRSPSRGVGTRNFIVLLGTTSRTGSYVKQLEERVKDLAGETDNLDGIVAVAHTEGGAEHPNNLDFLLRTLAGFIVHPNVAAVLAVDYGVEPVTNQMLRTFMLDHAYPLDDVPHHFLSLTDTFQAGLAQGEEIVRGWLEVAAGTARAQAPLSALKLALQCGGSDAFSGISGNPLAAWVAREIIRHGGAANLAETDELIGAEPYVLQKVRDLDTARKFLATMESFKARAAWHGHTAEGNPSGGNKFRGLYNIVLKSIGAAMKKHPDVRLDYVIDYSEQMTHPGYYFMDSPGNDLESIAGQVAAGSNLIYFVTGNGSITNFPFVPTIKIVTTSRRFRLLSRDMDVNAGAYLDGTSMDELGSQTFDLTERVASGERTVGEKAGHAQVQLWRNWRQTDAGNLDELQRRPAPAGRSLDIQPPQQLVDDFALPIWRANGHSATARLGLLLPTSLCAGQVARLAAHRLNGKHLGRDHQISRFVALVHTEGCGNSGGASEELYIRTMLGYLSHPMAAHCLFLEHGCEKTHNDYMRNQIIQMGLNPDTFGWASVQLDGGIELVLQKVEEWFADAIAHNDPPSLHSAGLESVRMGLTSAGPISEDAARALSRLTRLIVGAGGAVVVPQNAGLLSDPLFLHETLGARRPMPTLAYGQHMPAHGFHVMETPTAHWVETLTGLGATGVETITAYVGEHPLQTHPMVPVLQVSDNDQLQHLYGSDVDIFLQGDIIDWPGEILNRLAAIAAQTYTPTLFQLGNIDFQLTRGLLGVSL